MIGKKNDYLVGKGKPPKQTQFQKGDSGNLKGRPKGSKNFNTELEEILNAKVAVTEDGSKKKVTTRKATLMRLRELALNGNPRALDRFLTLAQQHAAEKEATATETNLKATEEDIIQRLFESHMPMAVEGDSDD